MAAPTRAQMHATMREALERELGTDELERLMAEGRARDLDELLDRALTLLEG